ncbi:MAG: cofactor assembly of complex C subunit B [Synechococcales cyanobacterium C42_A2020_086]|jgi:hypothetical protein|nr:cofactor assembly of complex C subunit B [Synechococcales cyanobacterium M58_A2018_015]MBF2073665.1 cofactor assembly of complex C subunit B [Synechococcales cyanobacterium C42_A2020_086]
MQIPVLTSTALLTVLLSVGLFFFIRASTKDRTQVVRLVANQQGESLLEQLQQYFTQRAYRLIAVDADQNRATFAGFVRPSLFLALFLSGLAGVGILCLALVLSLVFPEIGQVFLALLVLAPAAGLFYWQRAGRQEQVSLQVEDLASGAIPQSLITVTAHRDELAELQRSLGLKPLDPD